MINGVEFHACCYKRREEIREERNSGKAGKNEAKPRPLKDNYRYGSGFVMLLYGFIIPDSYERTFVSHGR